MEMLGVLFCTIFSIISVQGESVQVACMTKSGMTMEDVQRLSDPDEMLNENTSKYLECTFREQNFITPDGGISYDAIADAMAPKSISKIEFLKALEPCKRLPRESSLAVAIYYASNCIEEQVDKLRGNIKE